jgi:hypothetical protein
MKVAGFTFIKNAIKNDYSIVEAITSILPICDEFIVACGDSDDDTTQLIKNINSPKIKIIETQWEKQLKEGEHVFSNETNKALNAISTDADWAFYIQGDECVHEKYLDTIKKEMEICLLDTKIQGLLFHYKHFYGSYDFFAHSRRWYRREIRVIRNIKGMRSHFDAQGFRFKNTKLNVKLIDAYIYHYGWVKPPLGLTNKVRNFNTFYGKEDAWIDENYPVATEFDYGNADKLIRFNESHPKVFQNRVEKCNWKFDIDPTKVTKKVNFRRKFLAVFEQLFGIRLFEYKNYKIIK